VSAHTPGPWDFAGGTGGGLEIVRERAHGAGTIARVEQWNDAPRTEANARLISAAPDLLAALTATVLRVIKLGRGMHYLSCATNPREAPRSNRDDSDPVMLEPGACDCGAAEWATLTDAAIAKARGGK
jgi:hypothetical protein